MILFQRLSNRGIWAKNKTVVITHAYSRKDVKAARNCAASLGVDVIGTFGLILVANKKGHIEKPIAYLEKLKETGFRIGDDLFEHAIRLAGK